MGAMFSTSTTRDLDAVLRLELFVVFVDLVVFVALVALAVFDRERDFTVVFFFDRFARPA